MNKQILKRWAIGAGLLSLATLSACGGGDDATAPVAVVTPVPALEVVTVKRPISRVFDQYETLRVLEQVVAQGIPIRGIRCAQVFPPPSNSNTPTIAFYSLLLDVASTDAEKTKAFGFTPYTEADQKFAGSAPCI